MKHLVKENTVYEIRTYQDHKTGHCTSNNARKRPMSAPDTLPSAKKQKTLNVE